MTGLKARERINLQNRWCKRQREDNDAKELVGIWLIVDGDAFHVRFGSAVSISLFFFCVSSLKLVYIAGEQPQFSFVKIYDKQFQSSFSADQFCVKGNRSGTFYMPSVFQLCFYVMQQHLKKKKEKRVKPIDKLLG